jgi:hypothetical protein
MQPQLQLLTRNLVWYYYYFLREEVEDERSSHSHMDKGCNINIDCNLVWYNYFYSVKTKAT